MDFKGFPKIARLSRDVIVTEKLDGTNAQITITEDSQFLIGSRTRWITPENDNHGFARWVLENKEELMKLGVGSHFGEFIGSGIQRGYGLTEKRFYLFNVSRWVKDKSIPLAPKQDYCPDCCHVVPILYEGIFDTNEINRVLEDLRQHGSYIIPFMNPEGIVVYHKASGQMFKKTLDNDHLPKGCKE